MAVPGLVFPFPVLVIGRRCKKFRRSISAPALVSENGRLRPEHFVTMRTRCRNAVGDEDPARLVFFFKKSTSCFYDTDLTTSQRARLAFGPASSCLPPSRRARDLLERRRRESDRRPAAAVHVAGRAPTSGDMPSHRGGRQHQPRVGYSGCSRLEPFLLTVHGIFPMTSKWRGKLEEAVRK